MVLDRSCYFHTTATSCSFLYTELEVFVDWFLLFCVTSIVTIFIYHGSVLLVLLFILWWKGMKKKNIPFLLPLVLVVTNIFLRVFFIFIVSNLCWLLSGLFHLLHFSLQESLIHIPLPSFFFLMDNSLYSFVPLGSYQTQHRSLCMSIFHMNRKRVPASLQLFPHLECIILKYEKWLGLGAVSWIKLGRL